MRAEHEIHHAEALFQLLGHAGLLHHAAADRDEQVRVLRLGVDERAHVAQHAHLRVLAHGAGVDDYQISLVFIVREVVAHKLYVAAQLLAVGLVLLAAVGVHQREGPSAGGLDALAYLKAYLALAPKLTGGDFDSLVRHMFSPGTSIISDFIILTFRSGNFNAFEI